MSGRRLFLTTFIALIGFTVFGVVGYVLIEGYSLLDAVYMTVITLSTVGFGEVLPLSAAGKVFTIVLIVSGFGMVVSVVSLWAQRLLEGELRAMFSRRRFDRMLDVIRDHYIVCGYGHFGSKVAEDLLAREVPFVVVDSEGKAPDGVPSVHGDATDEDVLRRAGIERAIGLLTTFSNAADSVYAVLTAREINPALVIVARAEDPAGARRIARAGATRTVSTYDIGGHRMAQLALNPRVIDFVDMMMDARHRQMSVVEVAVSGDSPWVGVRLTDLEIEKTFQVVVLGVVPKGGSIELGTKPDRVLARGDVLMVFGDSDALARVIETAAEGVHAR